MTRRERAMAVLLAINLLLTATGYFWLSHQANAAAAAQQHAGQLVGTRLCATFGRLGALKPPPGPAAANPARGYEQQLHTQLVQLGTDVGCKG